MHQTRNILLFLFANLFFISAFEAQPSNNLRFTNLTNLTNLDGLSNNNINDIIKDHLGFLWVATNDGLCRYDTPHNFKVFTANDPQIENGLRSSHITALHLDSNNYLWIGTRLGGLSRYDIATNSWKTYVKQAKDEKGISNNEILCIEEDKKGRLWIGTENGLNLYLPETDDFHAFPMDKHDASKIGVKAILSINEDHLGRLWIGTWAGGLYLMLESPNGNASENTFRQFKFGEDKESLNVWTFFQDKDLRNWVGTHGGGLYLMEVPEDASNHPAHQDWNIQFLNYKHLPNDKESISDNAIQSIFQDENDQIWVGTVYGLNVFNPADLKKTKTKLSFKKYFFDPSNPHSLAHNNIRKIYKDDQGLIWLGTFCGISKYNWSTNQFQVHQLYDKVTNVPNTQCLYVDPEGTAWMGNGEEGLVRYNFKENKLEQFKDNDKLIDPNVTSLYCKDDENLLIGSRNGVTIYNLQSKSYRQYPISKEIKQNYPEFIIRCMYVDQLDRIWVGTAIGLFSIDPTTKKYTSYHYNDEDDSSISDNSINHIHGDTNGNIWIATYNGLNQLKVSTIHDPILFKRFYHEVDNPHSLPSNRVMSITDINGQLYIGTTTGLCSYSMNENKFYNLSKKEHRYYILGMETTSNNDLWACTAEGIFNYDIKNQAYNVFNKSDGLGDITFRHGASNQDAKGNLYFGSRLGITRFNPNHLVTNNTPPPVYVTAYKTMNPNGDEDQAIVQNQEVTLHHDDYYLALHFAALNYNRAEKNIYQYKLEGFDDTWIEGSANMPAVYTNLKHGDYTFKIRAANNDGIWNEEGASLKITVQPAFWETFLFQFLSTLFVIGCIYGGFQFYTKKVRQRNQALKEYNENLNKEIQERKRVQKILYEREQYMEELVGERTKELAIKNNEVKELLEELKIRNEELEGLVEERTKSLKSSNKELTRSNQDLEQFAYAASHDLQEPLRLIINFLSLLKKRYNDQLDATAQEYINFSVDAADRMSNLIRSLLTYSRVGQRGMEFQSIKLNTIIEAKLFDLSQVIKERNVSIEMDDLPQIHCEKNQIGIVFYNLINNAIKFNKSTTPTVHIRVHTDAPDGFWKFSVADNGIGIAPEYQQKIFEIFRRLHSNQEYKGTGIGLSLCQKIILRHGGQIWVESEVGKGTSFYFTIDKRLNMPHNDSIKTDEVDDKNTSVLERGAA